MDKNGMRRSQALLIVLLLLFVVGILSAGAARIFQAESRIIPLRQQGMAAFYLAQAGIERAKVEVLYGHWASGSVTSDWVDLDTVDNFTYQYRYTVTTPAAGTDRELKGEGRLVNKDDDAIVYAVRQIEAVVGGIEDILPLPPSQDGVDDDCQGTPVSWSWKEI